MMRRVLVLTAMVLTGSAGAAVPAATPSGAPGSAVVDGTQTSVAADSAEAAGAPRRAGRRQSPDPYELISRERMLAALTDLTAFGAYSGWRVSASSAEAAALDWMASNLEALPFLERLGLELERRELPHLHRHGDPPVSAAPDCGGRRGRGAGQRSVRPTRPAPAHPARGLRRRAQRQRPGPGRGLRPGDRCPHRRRGRIPASRRCRRQRGVLRSRGHRPQPRGNRRCGRDGHLSARPEPGRSGPGHRVLQHPGRQLRHLPRRRQRVRAGRPIPRAGADPARPARGPGGSRHLRLGRPVRHRPAPAWCGMPMSSPPAPRAAWSRASPGATRPARSSSGATSTRPTPRARSTTAAARW